MFRHGVSSGSARARSQVSRGVLLVGAALTALLSCTAEPPPTYGNLVVLLVDTLRADHLPTYGYARETAPTLARLAREGRALRGYAASSWTKPSVATLLTGQTPQTHQAIERADSLPPDVPYLPELLQQRGFATAAFMGNLNVGRKLGFGRGFDHYAQARGSRKIDARTVNRRSRALLDALEPPYFFYVHYVDPHDPYEPRVPWGASAAADAEPADPSTVVQPHRLLRKGLLPTPDERQGMIDRYDAEILEADRAIGDLLADLESRGLLDDTLVVLTSDHGEEFAEHGRLMHGRSLFEEVIEVPLIFWAKDAGAWPSGSSSEAMPRMHQLDVAATALEALGLADHSLGGSPRWTQVLQRIAPSEDLFFHLDLDGVGALAQIRGDLKLIHENRRPATQLFDLARDPDERAPLVGAAAASPGRELYRTLLRHHNAQADTAVAQQAAPVDAETLEALQALGYLERGPREEATPPALDGRSVPARLDAPGIPPRPAAQR